MQLNESKVILITNLQRPFTQIQLQELLCKSGNIANFWLEKIKTHCYVEVKFFLIKKFFWKKSKKKSKPCGDDCACH